MGFRLHERILGFFAGAFISGRFVQSSRVVDNRQWQTPNPKVLTMFMEMIDMPQLAKFQVSMHSESAVSPEPVSWLLALFKASPGTIRTYPNVQEFSIKSKFLGPRLPYVPMFRALPRMQRLIMSLPGFIGPDFEDCKSRYSCLHELRNLQLQDCNSFFDFHIRRFFKKVLELGELQNFELLEVENAAWLNDDRQYLETLLGDKLVWKS